MASASSPTLADGAAAASTKPIFVLVLVVFLFFLFVCLFCCFFVVFLLILGCCCFWCICFLFVCLSLLSFCVLSETLGRRACLVGFGSSVAQRLARIAKLDSCKRCPSDLSLLAAILWVFFLCCFFVVWVYIAGGSEGGRPARHRSACGHCLFGSRRRRRL